MRDAGGRAVFIEHEQIKFALGAQHAGQLLVVHPIDRLPQQVAAVALKGLAVRIPDVAEEAHHAPGRRPPGQHTQGSTGRGTAADRSIPHS